MIKTKSVFSAIEPSKDGLRVLATRFRGRGMSSARYHVWMANLGPSEELLRAVQAGKITWAEFGRRYRKELFEPGAVDRRNRTIRSEERRVGKEGRSRWLAYHKEKKQTASLTEKHSLG